MGATLPPSFQDLTVGIMLHHPETGAILDVNTQLEQLLGYPADELRSGHLTDFVAGPAEGPSNAMQSRIQAAAAGESQVYERQVERANGELLWVRIELNATTVDGQQYVIDELRDITQYKARERRLALLSRLLRHNLRNEMTVLRGHVAEAKQYIHDERGDHHIETAIDTADEMVGMWSSVRQIEEIADPQATQRRPINVRRVVGRLVEAGRSKYPSVTFTTSALSDVWVRADKGLTYALEHALNNAVVHNDVQTVTPTVAVESELQDGIGIVRIIDNGPPIPKMETDVLKRGIEQTNTYHGSGIGLWVLKECVESLGGDLTFGRRQPRGNVVTISLPSVPKSTIRG